MEHRGSDPNLGYSEGQLENDLPCMNWDQDLISTHSQFNYDNPPYPVQGSGPSQIRFTWQAPARPQTITHSAPQLYPTGPTSTTHNRPYHSGPIALSGHSIGLDTSGIFPTSDDRSAVRMDISPRQPTLGEKTQMFAPSSQSKIFGTSTHQLNEVTQHAHNEPQEAGKFFQMSSGPAQHYYQSSTVHPRKRPRSQGEEYLSISEGDNGTSHFLELNDAVKKISLEDEAKAIELIRKWLKGYSAETLPNSSDIDALALLTRMPTSEVNRLLVQMLLGRTKTFDSSTEAATSCEDSVNSTGLSQQLSMQQNNSRVPALVFERAVLWSKSRAQQCIRVQDISLLCRDPNKIYQCTLGCGKAFKKKADWMRHETTKNYPQDGWLCNRQPTSTINGVSICSYCHIKNPSVDHATNAHGDRVFCHNKQVKSQIYFRKDKFLQHCEKVHSSIDVTYQVDQAHFWIRSTFPPDCGFCSEFTKYSTCYDRFDHIGAHFEAGKDMTTWNQAHSKASNDDDNDDEDDDNDSDDENNSGDSGGAQFHNQNGQFDPRFSKHYRGDSGYNSKDSGQSSSNNSGSSMGNRHSTNFVADLTPPELLAQVLQDELSGSATTVNKMIGQQRVALKEQSNHQKLEDPKKTVAIPTKASSRSVLRNYFKSPSRDICTKGIAESDFNETMSPRPRQSQIHGNIQKLKEAVLSRLSLPGIKINSTKIKNAQPPPVTQENHIASGVTYDFPSSASVSSSLSSIASSATLVMASPSFEKELLSSLVPRSNNQFFLPISALKSLVKEDTIERELLFKFPIPFSGRSNLSSKIACSCCKLFAILIYLKKGNLISVFLDQHITDSDLPLRVPLALLRSENQGRLPKVFENWPWRDINDFCRAQWAFLPPVFDKLHKHYEFDDNDILPFIEDNEEFLRQGGYSEVWGVRIHHAHQLLLKSSGPGKEPMFAIKRLFSADSEEFKRETEMLQALSKLKHRHVLQLLATYKFRGRYHLVFPYAKHNLRELWNCNPNVEDTEWVAWSLRQMLGIASGLMQIHCFRPGEARSSISANLSPEDDLMFLVGGEERYGRHGDIKPENILWFDDMDENSEQGLLVIADFGLASFHGPETRSIVRPESIGGTITYAPPEVELHSKISRAYDIWSLGCVYLEFITWLLNGSEHLQAFCEARMEECVDRVFDDTFYSLFHNDNLSPPKAIVRPGVQSWIQALHDNPRCSDFLHELLDLISERMLSIEPEERVSSKQLTEELSRMLEKATKDASYLTKPTVHPSKSLGRSKTEIQQITASSQCTDLIKFNPAYILGLSVSHKMLDITCKSRSSIVSTEFVQWGRNPPAFI